MPSAPEELRREWTEETAWRHLAPHYDDRAGVISPKHTGYAPTEKDRRAIAYLVWEWDYAVSPV